MMPARKREEAIEKLKVEANSKQLQYSQALKESNIDWSQDPRTVSVAVSRVIDDLEPKGISYNRHTGIGFAKKHFQFVVGEAEANVFAELFEHINEQLDNKTVLELMGKKTNINVGRFDEVKELAKRLRKATGLSTHHLTAKKGTLTLIGTKINAPT